MISYYGTFLVALLRIFTADQDFSGDGYSPVSASMGQQHLRQGRTCSTEADCSDAGCGSAGARCLETSLYGTACFCNDPAPVQRSSVDRGDSKIISPNPYKLRQEPNLPSTITVNLVGTYSWQLLFHYDNTKNNGTIKQTEKITSSVSTSYDDLVKYSLDETTKMHLGFGGSPQLSPLLPITLSNATLNGSYDTEVKEAYSRTVNFKASENNTFERTQEFNIAGGGELSVYRRVFNGPGVSVKTEATSSIKGPDENVTISLIVTPHYFLKNIQVLVTDDHMGQPPVVIREENSNKPNINSGFPGKHIWLIPTWTAEPSETLTSVSSVTTKTKSDKGSDVWLNPGGVGEWYRYLTFERDPRQSGIIEIELIRKFTPSSPEGDKWEKCSNDINKNRLNPFKRSFLYLCWNTAASLKKKVQAPAPQYYGMGNGGLGFHSHKGQSGFGTYNPRSYN